MPIIPQAKPDGSNGEIQFNDNQLFGADSNLVWDDTNKRLGIGITVPPTALTIGNGGILQINSAGDDKNIQLSHDDSNAIISTSSGNLYLDPDSDAVYLFDNTSSFEFWIYDGATAKVGLRSNTTSFFDGGDLSVGAGDFLVPVDNKKIIIGDTAKMEMYSDGTNVYIDSVTSDIPLMLRYNDFGTLNEGLTIHTSGGFGKPNIRIGTDVPHTARVLTIRGFRGTDGIRLIDNGGSTAQWGGMTQASTTTTIESSGNIAVRPSNVLVGWFGVSNAFSLYRDKRFHFSEAGGSGCAFLYDNTHQDTDIPTFRLLLDDHTTGLGDKTMIFLITGYGDLTYSFGHQPQLNPTIFLHSSNRTQTEWISFTHDQTDGVIETGTGDLHLKGITGIKIDGIKLEIVAKTGAYTTLATDDVITCGAGNQTFTVTLIALAATVTSKVYSIKNVGTGVITVDGNSAETIDGQATQLINQFECLKIIAGASEWHVI